MRHAEGIHLPIMIPTKVVGTQKYQVFSWQEEHAVHISSLNTESKQNRVRIISDSVHGIFLTVFSPL